MCIAKDAGQGIKDFKTLATIAEQILAKAVANLPAADSNISTTKAMDIEVTVPPVAVNAIGIYKMRKALGRAISGIDLMK